MQIQVITLPYDSAQHGERMGAGPGYFIQHGLIAHLQHLGHEAHIQQLEADLAFQSEITTSFALYRLLADAVQRARALQRFPLVLSGNCSSALGTVAGCAPEQLGVIWFDGHGDFHTPETTWSGFLDGMGLATLTGHCWHTLAARIPGFHAIPESAVLHIGGRDFGEQEEQRFAQSQIARLHPSALRASTIRTLLEPVLHNLQIQRPSIYLHIDLDVLDSTEAPANEYAAPNGLRVSQMQEIIGIIGEYVAIQACGVASYDPAYDPDQATVQAGFELITRVLTMVQTVTE
jgi:arginase